MTRHIAGNVEQASNEIRQVCSYAHSNGTSVATVLSKPSLVCSKRSLFLVVETDVAIVVAAQAILVWTRIVQLKGAGVQAAGKKVISRFAAKK